ncbi:Carboxylesterase [Macrophomina phaseolina]|uniref:Carboxylic ester hydrolase n=1 Tax=Macrophomina phaseolina TaxID=35725 RepID=A0ABQ8G0P3_9PEZI|nr:Carboxylesterase [Macrophomina phaseolina]
MRAAAPLLLLAASSASAQNASETLPVVDLGYELYRATEFNETGAYYNFSNIRYAAPPVGELRFRPPVRPSTNRSAVRDGSELRICPQANPAWSALAAQWLPQYLLTGQAPNISLTTTGEANVTTGPAETEDCLFLDVIVPQAIFEKAGRGYGAPVLVWIYGGGYTAGSKSGSGDPTGLIQRSRTNSSDGVIYVALNYRLGALGWLAGPTYQEDGTANLGLYDQRLALQWVQDNIHLFGGDKNRVTVLGESAGGGSIMHQITAFGGSAPSLFQQAVPQSPGWQQIGSPYSQEQTFSNFLKEANVTSLAEARNLPSEDLMAANARLVAASPYGSYTFGPAIDGNIVPQDPKYLLNHGQFDRSVKILVGHNSNEGLLFVPPVSKESDFVAFINTSFSSAKPAVIDYITNTLYPPIYDGSRGYRDLIGRVSLAVAESSFTCNAFALDRAYGNETYAYLFGVAPGLHGQDIPYTYYNPDAPRSAGGLSLAPTNQTIAFALQDYITSFAATGIPDSPVDGLPLFPVYGEDAEIVSLNSSSISEAMDPAANARCRWWQLGLYY